MTELIWKIHLSTGKFIAACLYAEDAAALVASHGASATIRIGHTNVVWKEGKEIFGAGESYDRVASIIKERAREIERKRLVSFHGANAAAKIQTRLDKNRDRF